MILDGLRVESLLLGLIVENFGNDNFFRDVVAVLILVMRSAISCIALWKTRRVAESRRIEEWMRLVDSCVDITDFNAGTGSRPAASGNPGVRRINDLVALAQIRVVQRVVLGALHHRSGCDCRQRRAVELHRHCVK